MKPKTKTQISAWKNLITLGLNELIRQGHFEFNSPITHTIPQKRKLRFLHPETGGACAVWTLGPCSASDVLDITVTFHDNQNPDLLGSVVMGQLKNADGEGGSIALGSCYWMSGHKRKVAKAHVDGEGYSRDALFSC